MSPDPEGDSLMRSSPSSSDGPSTPNTNQLSTGHPASSTLSPPDSEPRSSSTASMANANGKRPLHVVNIDDEDETPDMKQTMQGNLGKTRAEFPTKTHEASGYSWSRAEDEPGYAWGNKKATDEFHRAWDGLVHRDHMVKGRYGDPFEMADRERAMINSMKQS